jgi:hypothetical protein
VRNDTCLSYTTIRENHNYGYLIEKRKTDSPSRELSFVRVLVCVAVAFKVDYSKNYYSLGTNDQFAIHDSIKQSVYHRGLALSFGILL